MEYRCKKTVEPLATPPPGTEVPFTAAAEPPPTQDARSSGPNDAQPSASIDRVPGTPPFSAEYFEQHRGAKVTRKQKHHNWALKWNRKQNAVSEQLDPNKTMWCPEVVHPYEGDTDSHRAAIFNFEESKLFPWNWRDLVASLRKDDIQRLCHGDLGVRSSGQSLGLMSCRCGFDPHSKDSAMAYMEKAKAKAEGRQFEELTEANYPKQFDFIFERSDGVSFTLHPKHKGKKVSVKVKTGNEEPAPALEGGPGTFQLCYKWNKSFDVEFRH